MKTLVLDSLKSYIRLVSFVLLAFFAAFMAAHLVPAFRAQALGLTPWFIFLFGSLCLYPTVRLNGKPFTVWAALVFVVIFVLSALGAANDAVFGAFEYGPTLGLRLFDTPFMAVYCWLLVLYAATRFAQSRLQGTSGVVGESIVAVCTGVVIMFYEAMLVPVAPRLGYMFFMSGSTGFKHYFVWFLIGSVTAFTYLYYIRPRVAVDERGEQERSVEKAASRLIGLFALCQTVFLIIIRLVMPEQLG